MKKMKVLSCVSKQEMMCHSVMHLSVVYRRAIRSLIVYGLGDIDRVTAMVLSESNPMQ